MSIDNLDIVKGLIADTENDQVEFKETTGQLERSLDENAIMGAVRAGINSGRLPEVTIREEIPAILEKFVFRIKRYGSVVSTRFAIVFTITPEVLSA